MNSIAINTMPTAAKFDKLILVEDGIVLKYRKKRERIILFSELDKIYIKTYKLTALFQLVFITCPFFLALVCIQYLRFDILILLGFFIIIPFFLKVNNYKWYRLRIVLKDGTFFTKKVSVNVKHENITTVNKVKKEWFNYNVNAVASA